MEPQMFRHDQVSLPEIKAKTTNGVRLYETPEGNKYPSITTVLSVRNKQGLFEWRKRVGEDVANHIARTAAARGTKVHHMCCLLYTSPSPRDMRRSRMPSSA